jgi:hypothetical protein
LEAPSAFCCTPHDRRLANSAQAGEAGADVATVRYSLTRGWWHPRIHQGALRPALHSGGVQAGRGKLLFQFSLWPSALSSPRPFDLRSQDKLAGFSCTSEVEWAQIRQSWCGSQTGAGRDGRTMFTVSNSKGDFGRNVFPTPSGIKVPSMGKWIARFSA